MNNGDFVRSLRVEVGKWYLLLPCRASFALSVEGCGDLVKEEEEKKVMDTISNEGEEVDRCGGSSVAAV